MLDIYPFTDYHVSLIGNSYFLTAQPCCEPSLVGEITRVKGYLSDALQVGHSCTLSGLLLFQTDFSRMNLNLPTILS